LNENLVNKKIFRNLKPELVDTRDPPTIIKIRKMKLFWFIKSKENPIFEILLINENNVIEKLLD
tara:strand:+ start:374 stop:565 length:192 start_codon:yes stop_codon:yes gene_type:complete